MWGWLRAFIQGVVAPFVAAYQQHQHGRTAQQRDDAIATREVERAISETLARDDDVRAARERAVRDILRAHLGEREAADRGGASAERQRQPE